MELPHAALQGAGTAARLPAQLPEPLHRRRDAARHLPARTHVLRRQRSPGSRNRRTADDAKRDPRPAGVGHLSHGRTRQSGRPAAGSARAVRRHRTAGETHPRRRREDGPHHGARPARADRAGARSRAHQCCRGCAVARVRSQGDGNHRRRRFQQRGTDGRRAGGAEGIWRGRDEIAGGLRTTACVRPAMPSCLPAPQIATVRFTHQSGR